MEGQFLRITGGNAAGAEIALDEDLLLGRSASGSGSLAGDTELSREHARITRSAGGEIVIEDLGSTNGTIVNGHRITAPTPIGPGDNIKVGGSTLEVAGTAPAGAQPTKIRARVRPPVAPTVEAERDRPPAPGPPPGVPGPPGGPGGKLPRLGALPPPIASRIRRMAIIAALAGFVVGFVIATIVWAVL